MGEYGNAIPFGDSRQSEDFSEIDVPDVLKKDAESIFAQIEAGIRAAQKIRELVGLDEDADGESPDELWRRFCVMTGRPIVATEANPNTINQFVAWWKEEREGGAPIRLSWRGE